MQPLLDLFVTSVVSVLQAPLSTSTFQLKKTEPSQLLDLKCLIKAQFSFHSKVLLQRLLDSQFSVYQTFNFLSSQGM